VNRAARTIWSPGHVAETLACGRFLARVLVWQQECCRAAPTLVSRRILWTRKASNAFHQEPDLSKLAACISSVDPWTSLRTQCVRSDGSPSWTSRTARPNETHLQPAWGTVSIAALCSFSIGYWTCAISLHGRLAYPRIDEPGFHSIPNLLTLASRARKFLLRSPLTARQ
jgi:hypothetical protein